MFIQGVKAQLRGGTQTGRTAMRRAYSMAIFLEHSHGKLARSLRSVVEAARRAKPEETLVGVLPIDSETSPSVTEAAETLGLDRLLVGKSASHFGRLLAEPTASFLAQMQEQHQFSHWWATHSSIGKDVIFRMAGVLLTRSPSSPNREEATRLTTVSDIIEVVLS